MSAPVSCAQGTPAPWLSAAPLGVSQRWVVTGRDELASTSCRLVAGASTDVPLWPMPRRTDRGPPFELTRVDGIPVLRVRTFWENHDAALRAFPATADALRDEPIVVVDVRGHNGGVDRYTNEWFSRLTSQPLWSPSERELTSEVTMQGLLNELECLIATAEGPPAPELLEKRAARARELRDAEARGERFTRWAARASRRQRAVAPKPYAGRLIVLTDRGCASACENFLMRAQQLPRTLLVGDNTKGTGVLGQVRPYRLPNSGIVLRLSTKLFTEPRGFEVEEGVGYTPHVRMMPDEHALPTVIACVRDPACLDALAATRR